ncbi:DUF1161 domain-containing protein [Larsenimonas rhizosphaerae]|uniref:DUF1161 domain-containing protein n=1 Tax=Larsenimonas rhizosphaerae TaxID=2944682 RepID=UPI00203323EB|nr:DUF1161 domain-containing protein [Larsenimonas rhizosphaerae]MCM2130693.1 DUF1161 domain-containing protein [Larsenimonas rhizosphaerae]
MRHFLKVTVCVGLLANAGAAFASCSTTMDDIASKIHGNGVPYNQFSLNTVKMSDADSAEGKMVGSCSNRYFAIMYTQHAPRPSSNTDADNTPSARIKPAPKADGNDKAAAKGSQSEKKASSSSADTGTAKRRHDTYRAAPQADDTAAQHKHGRQDPSVADMRKDDLFKSEADGTPWYLK